jgi:hypothetical protein
VPFAFTGKLDKVTFKLGPTQLGANDQAIVRSKLANAKD